MLTDIPGNPPWERVRTDYKIIRSRKDIISMPAQKFNTMLSEASNARAFFRTNGSEVNSDAGKDNIAKVLMGYALSQALPHQTVTDESVQEFWDNGMGFITENMESFLRTTPGPKLRELASRNDNGMALDHAFRTYIAGMDRLPEWMDDRLYPTAYARIVKLKENMKAGKYQSMEAKRICLAEFIAAREHVNAGRGYTFGYNSKLDGKLDRTVAERAERIQKELETISDEDINRLFAMGLNRGEGGAMEEALNEIRKSPIDKEIERLHVGATALDTRSDELKRNVASQIVLLRSRDLSREEQRTFLASADYQDQVTELMESPAFLKLVQNNSPSDLQELAWNTDTSLLIEEYDTASSEVENSPFSALYDKFADDPGEFEKFQQDLAAIMNNQAYQSKAFGDSLADAFRGALRETYYDMMDLPDKVTFIDYMEKIQAYYTMVRKAARRTKDTTTLEELNELPGFKNILDRIPLPKEGTAGEYALEIRAAVFFDGADGTGKPDILSRYLELYRKVGDRENWEDVPITAEDLEQFLKNIKERDDADTERYQERNFFEKLTNQKSYHLLSQRGNGKAVSDFYGQWKQEKEDQLNKRTNQTAKERLEEILSFPSRKDLFTRAEAEPDLIGGVFFDVLGARALERDASKHPEKYRTREDVDKAFNDFRENYVQAYNKDFRDPKLAAVLNKDQTGEAAEEYYKKNIVGDVVYGGKAKLPEEDLPILKEHIESLQDQLKNGKLKTRHNKIRAAAVIISARKAMGITRGGDKKLGNRMTKEAFEETKYILDAIEYMPEQVQDRLISKIRTGHGGELMKEFTKLNTYNNFVENRKNHFAKHGIRNSGPVIAEIIAATMQGMGPLAGKKGMNSTADLEGIAKSSRDIRNSEAYRLMLRDPETIALTIEGNGQALIGKLMEANTQIEEAKKQKKQAENVQEAQKVQEEPAEKEPEKVPEGSVDVKKGEGPEAGMN